MFFDFLRINKLDVNFGFELWMELTNRISIAWQFPWQVFIWLIIVSICLYAVHLVTYIVIQTFFH